jgi:hypothetical protein
MDPQAAHSSSACTGLGTVACLCVCRISVATLAGFLPPAAAVVGVGAIQRGAEPTAAGGAAVRSAADGGAVAATLAILQPHAGHTLIRAHEQGNDCTVCHQALVTMLVGSALGCCRNTHHVCI